MGKIGRRESGAKGLTYLEALLGGAKVEWRSLGEVAEIGTGRSNKRDEDAQGGYPLYVRSATILRSSTYEFDEKAIIIPGEGGIGDIFHYVDGKYALHQRAYRIHIYDLRILPKFVYYFMTAHFKEYILPRLYRGTVFSIRKGMLSEFLIPLPPLPIQQQIVDILDKFHTLVHSLTEGLPAEIALRRQQYEYYRNQLLRFPR